MTRMSAADRREQLLALARDEFAEHGLHAASIDAIAQRAGITQAYVFRIFGTKKALFLEVYEDAYTQLIDGLRRAVGETRGLAAVDLMSPQYLERLTDRSRMRLQLQGLAACGDDEIREAVRAQFRRLWEAVEELTGTEPIGTKAFLSFGLFMSAAAAMEIDGLDEPWARGVATPVRGGLFEHITGEQNHPATGAADAADPSPRSAVPHHSATASPEREDRS